MVTTLYYTLNAYTIIPSAFDKRKLRPRLPSDTCRNGAPSCFPSRRALPVRRPLCVTECLRFGFMLHTSESLSTPHIVRMAVLSKLEKTVYVLVFYPLENKLREFTQHAFVETSVLYANLRHWCIVNKRILHVRPITLSIDYVVNMFARRRWSHACFNMSKPKHR